MGSNSSACRRKPRLNAFRDESGLRPDRSPHGLGDPIPTTNYGAKNI